MEPVDILIIEELPFVFIRNIFPEICSIVRVSLLYYFTGLSFLTPFVLTDMLAQMMIVIPNSFANSIKQNITPFIQGS